MRRLPRVLAVTVFLVLPFRAAAQVGVQDVFGRSLNQHGITLVDWDGYMAIPLIKVYLYAPTNASLPGSAMLSANGDRLYFDTPSTVSSNGPVKTVSIASAGVGVPAQLSIFPDRDGVSEDYTLTVVFTDANSATQTNTVPIHVMDLDLQRTNAFVVTANFDRDATGVFTNALRRMLTQQAANDWAYFFGDMNLDPVPAGSEITYIWSNNFDGGYYFTCTNAIRAICCTLTARPTRTIVPAVKPAFTAGIRQAAACRFRCIAPADSSPRFTATTIHSAGSSLPTTVTGS